MPDALTKQQLIDVLRESGELAASKIEAVPEERLQEGRYESGWNGRQILAHIAAIEWTYPRLLDLGREASDVPKAAASAPAAAVAPPSEVKRTSPAEASGTPTRGMQGGVNGYNERQVEKRAEASVDELIAEFRKNRAALIAAVEAADDALLAKEVRSAGGVTGALSGVVYALAVQHMLGHASDLTGERLVVGG